MKTETQTKVIRALRRDVTLKDGRKFNEGEKFEIAFSLESERSPYFTATRVADGASYKSKQFGAFFPRPDVGGLQDWVNDGICETVTGEMTEPDGYGPDGSPSWLLALGMI